MKEGGAKEKGEILSVLAVVCKFYKIKIEKGIEKRKRDRVRKIIEEKRYKKR